MEKRFLSALLSLCVLLAILMPALAADEAELYHVIPELSDGLTAVDFDPASMLVRGTLSGGMFTFSEDAELTFTVKAEDGWTYSSTYSYFFDTDVNNRMISEQNDAVTFTYQAKRGNSIVFSDLTTVLINATPDKLPTLYITVDGGIDSVNKSDWVSAEFRLEAGTKVFESGNTYAGTGEIKGRGNSSWGQAQKPYSIKLEKKESLLGIPATKKYAIISSAIDESFMRNYIAYKSALSMIGIQYSPKIEFVEVYIDGIYRGIYSLVERIDIEKTKVDIEETDPASGNLTGGYIIEKDAGDKIDRNNDPWFLAPFQSNPYEDVFTLKSPDPDEEGEMIKYLSSYINDVHNALMSSEEEAQKYVDFSSWADFLILQEIAKNIDGNLKTSCYFVKERDNNVLRMDAPWDFDLAFGNPGAAYTNGKLGKNDYDDCPMGTTPDGFMVINSSCPWFQTLYSYGGFYSLVCERYSKYRAEMIPDMQNMVYEQAAYLSNAAVSHAEKWGGDFSSSVDTLRSFLNDRIEWLDSQWLDTSNAAPADDDTPWTNPFTDVSATSPFAEAINWAVEKNIMTGKTDTTFAPGEECTNGQILTFLWRANGSPEPTVDNPFTDPIPASFQKAAVWAYEKGIVSGAVFGSSTTCTRAVTVEYLWKAAGSPTTSGNASFTDVSADADYAQAVAWAVENGVTSGTGNGQFSPAATCTRGQIATFLYRVMGK